MPDSSGLAVLDAFGTSRAPHYGFHSDGVHMEKHDNLYHLLRQLDSGRSMRPHHYCLLGRRCAHVLLY